MIAALQPLPFTMHLGDAREVLPSLPAESVQCCVTSPPYWGLRDYGAAAQLGLESSPEEYVAHLVEVFREVRRVLRDDGTLWLNLGDSYASGAGRVGAAPGGGEQGDRWAGRSVKRGERTRGLRDGRHAGKHTAMAALGPMTQPNRLPIPGLKPKDLCGIPWRVALALQADGWWLRADIIWAKPCPMPESVKDRPTRSHEYLFLLAKSASYRYDADAISERLRHPESSTADDIARAFGRRRSTIPKPYQDAPRLVGSPPSTRNRRSVWTIAPEHQDGLHFATFPTKLVEPCVLAGSRPGDLVLDPFSGTGTTGVVALKQGRRYLGVELNSQYLDDSLKRLRAAAAQRLLPFRREEQP